MVISKKKSKLIVIGLSKQTKLKDPQQISFVGKPKKDHRAIMCFVIEKSGESTFNFSQNSTLII